MENQGPSINELIDWRMCCEMAGNSIRAAELVNYTITEIKELMPSLRQAINEKNIVLTESATRDIMDSRLSRVPLTPLYESFSELADQVFIYGKKKYPHADWEKIKREASCFEKELDRLEKGWVIAQSFLGRDE